jgi:hypothetical protein
MDPTGCAGPLTVFRVAAFEVAPTFLAAALAAADFGLARLGSGETDLLRVGISHPLLH